MEKTKKQEPQYVSDLDFLAKIKQLCAENGREIFDFKLKFDTTFESMFLTVKIR